MIIFADINKKMRNHGTAYFEHRRQKPYSRFEADSWSNQGSDNCKELRTEAE